MKNKLYKLLIVLSIFISTQASEERKKEVTIQTNDQNILGKITPIDIVGLQKLITEYIGLDLIKDKEINFDQVIQSAKLCHNNKIYLSCGYSNEIKIFDLNTFQVQKEFHKLKSANKVSFSNDGKNIALYFEGKSASGQIKIYDIDSEKYINTIKTRTNSLAFSNDSKYLAVNSAYVLKLYQISKEKTIDVDVDFPIGCIKFSPDNGKIICQSDPNRLIIENPILINIGDKLTQKDFGKGFALITATAFSQNSKYIVTGDRTGNINIFDDKGEIYSDVTEKLKRNKDANLFALQGIAKIIFSNDSKYIVAHTHGKLEIWNIERKEIIQEINIPGNSNGSISLFFTPDNKYLVLVVLEKIYFFQNLAEFVIANIPELPEQPKQIVPDRSLCSVQ